MCNNSNNNSNAAKKSDFFWNRLQLMKETIDEGDNFFMGLKKPLQVVCHLLKLN